MLMVSNLQSKETGWKWDTRLTPVILAPWEAEIRRIMVRSQPRQKFHEPLHLNQWTVSD
jgi:hypothetical protein